MLTIGMLFHEEPAVQSLRQTESPLFPLPNATEALLAVSAALGLESLRGIETPHSQGDGALRATALSPLSHCTAMVSPFIQLSSFDQFLHGFSSAPEI